MKCYECGGSTVNTKGQVKMTCSDGSLVIFKDIPMTQCRQCGEQYISGKWTEKIGYAMRHCQDLKPDEIVPVPVVSFAAADDAGQRVMG